MEHKVCKQDGCTNAREEGLPVCRACWAQMWAEHDARDTALWGDTAAAEDALDAEYALRPAPSRIESPFPARDPHALRAVFPVRRRQYGRAR